MKNFFILLLMANVFNLFGAQGYTPSWATSKPRLEGDYTDHEAYNDPTTIKSRQRVDEILAQRARPTLQGKQESLLAESLHADIMNVPGTVNDESDDTSSWESILLEDEPTVTQSTVSQRSVESSQPTTSNQQTSLTSLLARLKAWWNS